MNRERVLLDSPIIIDALLGVEPAVAVVDNYADRAISIITWIEVLAGIDPSDHPTTKIFLRSFARIELDDEVADATVAVRQQVRLKLPDAIILASARVERRMLLTRDSKDFGRLPGERISIPYTL